MDYRSLLNFPLSDLINKYLHDSMLTKIEEQKELAQKESDQEAKKLKLLEKLYTSPYEDRKDRNPERVDGTCEWFTSHPYFRSWQESKISSLLWVSADPGCGKSVLAKYLADAMLPSTRSRTTCYFFFKDDFEDQRNAASAFCCVLRQIFIQNDALLSKNILQKFEADGEKLISSFRGLWDILVSVANENKAGELVCILDALDECEDKGRSQIAQVLSEFYGTRKHTFTLKFLLTSRPYVHIQREFQILENRLPTIHLSGEGELELEKISREINVFIKSRVKNIGEILQLELEEQQLLQDELLCVPNRTYLWVHLTLDVVQNSLGLTKSSISAVIKKIPRTVDEAYERILCKSHNFEKAKRLLHIIVAAARPLSLKEMALALSIQETHQSYDDLEIEPESRFRNTVRELCGLFVTVIDSKIYLLHQTAKEFLVQKSIDPPKPSAHSHIQWKFSLWPGDSNRILAEICIWYLLFKEFETSRLDANAPSRVFLDYSAKHWAAHYREAHITHDAEITPLVLKICDTSSQKYLIWFKSFWTNTVLDVPENFTTLMVASYFGLERVVKLLLEMDGVDLNATDANYGRSALSWAAGNGHEVVVKLLITRAKVDSKATFKLRLKKRAKANINTRDTYGATPLLWTAKNGHGVVAQLLLTYKAEVDARNVVGETPLLYAAENGYTALVQLLLDYKADVNARDGLEQTPLVCAATNGHVAVVQLLLTYKADVNARDCSGETPLYYAVGNGHTAVIQLLLMYKADVHAVDEQKWTLLWSATKNGDTAIAQLLLDYKANANGRNSDGHDNVVRLLRERVP